MTVHPFPLARPVAPPAPALCGITPFPIIARGTALLRRPVTMRDIDAGVRIIHHPRTGKIRHDITRRDARAARSRLRRLRQGKAQWRGVTWFDAQRRVPVTLTDPAPTVVALLTGLAAFGAVVALLTRGWS